MLNKLEFLLTLLVHNKQKHAGVFLLSSLLVALLCSILFISSSLQKDIFSILNDQADITMQRYERGKVLDMPQSWLNDALEINGVSNAQARVYGTYYYEPKEHHFMIIGIDFYDSQIVASLQKLVEGIDIDKFLSKNSMLIGAGVKEFFDKYAYYDYYIFRPPDRSKQKVYIYKTLPQESSLLSNDTIIMDVDLAKKILGIKKNNISDIIINVANKEEFQTIYNKLLIKHFNSRIITKKDITQHYKNIFNFKGGFFIALYTTALLTFLLILYQRYSLTQNSDVKEIEILRCVGWNIEQIIFFKVAENGIIAFCSYTVGVFTAYVYVFVFGAPVLQRVFLGEGNLQNHTNFTPVIAGGDLATLFAFFVLPLLFVVVIPIWKLSTKDIGEQLR